MTTPAQLASSVPLTADLAAWLSVATAGLVPSAQARVRAEIETHYAEAVAVYQKNGQEEAPAHAAALADLGNAQKAARHFGEIYLNQRDIPRYLRPLSSAQLFGFLIFHGLLILVWGWWAVKVITSPKASLWPDVVWSALAFTAFTYPVLSTMILSWLTRREFNLANLRAKHWGGFLYMVNGWLFISLWISEMGMDSWFSWILLVYIIVSVPINIFEFLNVRRKLLAATESDLAEPLDA